MAVLSACAGAIHLAMAPIHAGDARREAVAFAVVGALQVLLAGLVLRTGRSTALVASGGLGLVTATAWAWSRQRALPFDLGGPEDPGLVDGLTAGYELATAAIVALALAPPARRWWAAISTSHLVPLHVIVAVATVAVLAAPSTAEHGHAPGDDHGTSTAGAGSDDHAHGSGGGATDAEAPSCPEAGHDDPVTEPPLDFPGPRLDAARTEALEALAAQSPPLPCGTIAAGDGGHGGHGGAGHGDLTPVESPLPAGEAARFDTEWSAASAAALALATPRLAAAAGYVQSSPQAPGVGTHWIDWTLIGAPFDPARPSMLLFDERPNRPARLVGFSYWNRSAPGPPDGFAGPNDVWHGHVGLCFVDGWLFQEDVPSADDCGGAWLNGTDLWMLHAWVVPDLPNPSGRFAGRHPAVCPGDLERIADALTCDPAGS